MFEKHFELLDQLRAEPDPRQREITETTARPLSRQGHAEEKGELRSLLSAKMQVRESVYPPPRHLFGSANRLHYSLGKNLNTDLVLVYACFIVREQQMSAEMDPEWMEPHRTVPRTRARAHAADTTEDPS